MQNLIGPYILIISNGVKKNASDVFNILSQNFGLGMSGTTIKADNFVVAKV